MLAVIIVEIGRPERIMIFSACTGIDKDNIF